MPKLSSHSTRPPTLEESRAAITQLNGQIDRTPVRHWAPDDHIATLPDQAELFLKLELFQRTGSFKVRGALMNILSADDDRESVQVPCDYGYKQL